MIVLDFRDKRPIYEQVVEKMSHLIASGVLEEGSRLPSVRSLAIELSVNPNTIQRAYAQLEQDGYIYTVSGRGNFVSPASAWRELRLGGVEAELRSVLLKAKQSGLERDDLEAIIAQVFDGSGEDKND